MQVGSDKPSELKEPAAYADRLSLSVVVKIRSQKEKITT